MLLLFRSLVVLTLLFAPWAFGSVEPWSQRTLQLLVFCAFASAFIRVIRGRPTPFRDWRWVVPLALFAAYIAIQALNASHRHQPADQSLVPQPYTLWLPHSVDAATTWEALGMLLTYAALFWVMRVCFCNLEDRGLRSKVRDSADHASPITHHESDPCSIRVNPWLRTLLTILVISGFAMSLLAIIQYLSGGERVLWGHSLRLKNPAGPFVNRNNYAACINLLIPIALALGTRHSPFAIHHSRPISDLLRYLPASPKSNPGFLLCFMAAVMITSIFLAGSRAGMIICAGIVATWTVARWSPAFRRKVAFPSPFLSISFLALMLVGLVLCLGYDSIKPQLARLQTVSDELTGPASRLAIYHSTFSMFQDHWLFGIGAGAFSSAFPFYQPDGLPGFFRYAHNDWLQWLSELGVAGSMLAFSVLCSLCFFVAGSRRSVVGSLVVPRSSAPRFPLSAFRFPLLLSLIGVYLHALVDFPLHIPGIATLAVAYLALLSPQMTQIHADGARHMTTRQLTSAL